MTDWSSVEFTCTAGKSRKSQDFLPIISDLLVVWDFLACAATGEGALALYARHAAGQTLDFSASGPFCRDILFGSLIAALVLRNNAGLLNHKLSSLYHFVLQAEQRCFLAFTVLITVGLATRATSDLARLWLMSWLGLFALAVATTRIACGHYLRWLHGRGELRESIAIVGASGVRDRLAARIKGEADVVGLYSAQSWADEPACNVTRDDSLADLLELGRYGGVDSVILALERGHQVDVSRIVQRLKALPIQVAVCSDDGWSSKAAPRIRILGGLPMSVVADRPIKPWDMLIKTALDKFGATTLLILLSPLLLGIAVVVWTTSGGPVIFRQKRQGWCGRDFTVFKFRTMRSEAAIVNRRFQTLRNDTRCTAVGRLLRRCSLDELPQLWNVLRGDMSLVGPRPHADSLHDVDRAGREIVAEYAQRNRVKPGMTGWAQVHGARGATATLEQLRHRVDYDLFYIENWSIWLDLRILLRTPFCLSGENAF